MLPLNWSHVPLREAESRFCGDSPSCGTSKAFEKAPTTVLLTFSNFYSTLFCEQARSDAVDEDHFITTGIESITKIFGT